MLKSGFESVWIGLLLTKLCQKGFRTVNNLIYHSCDTLYDGFLLDFCGSGTVEGKSTVIRIDF